MAIHNDPLKKFSTLPFEVFSIIADYSGDSPARLGKQLLSTDRILIENDEFNKNRLQTLAELQGIPIDPASGFYPVSSLLNKSGIDVSQFIDDKGQPRLDWLVICLYECYRKRISEIDPSGKYHLSLDNLPKLFDYDKAFNKIQVWKQLPGGSEYLNSDQMRNLPLTEQASQFKAWLESHPAIVHSVNSLNLSGHKLTSIPEEIGLLTDLTNLDLSNNQISKIENLDGLNQLRELDLYNNRISKMENLNALNQLTTLVLSTNRIKKMENMDTLTHLQLLDLSYNQISEMENMGALTQLQGLDLSHNLISKMENMNTLTELQYVKLSDNQISKMENMDALTKLIKLSLSNNPISKLENMDALHELRFIYLTKYHVYENSDYLLQFPDLKTILE